jgi:hypothetical protein
VSGDDRQRDRGSTTCVDEAKVAQVHKERLGTAEGQRQPKAGVVEGHFVHEHGSTGLNNRDQHVVGVWIRAHVAHGDPDAGVLDHEGAVERDFPDLRQDARACKGVWTNGRLGTQDIVPQSARAVANDCGRSSGHQQSNARGGVVVSAIAGRPADHRSTR